MAISRTELESRLAALEAALPELSVDIKTFLREFEDRAEAILDTASDQDRQFASDKLLAMLGRSGITRREGYKAPKLN